MARIDYFLSLMSPWAYFAGNRLEEIAARHGVETAYKPIDTAQVFPALGTLALPQRPPARKAYRLQELRRTSSRTGMPYHETPAHWPVDAAPASRALIALAEAGGNAGGFAQAVLRAVWAEQRDVSDPAVVAELIRGAGGDPGTMAEAMERAGEAYAANAEEAATRGVFGVPFYMVGEEMFWGQDRLADLDWHLARI
ncbi:MAG: 2-hydroxychromene-2-carboxylate isomerase [Pseudomonadota bacterium]